MPTDAAHAKFLYTILKQLDLKSIDWNLVASQLEITNGHAARMRFSRFKQQMEGVTPGSRRRASSMAGGEGRVDKRHKSEKGRKNKRDKEPVRDERAGDDDNGGPSSATAVATTIEPKVEEITTIKPELLSLYSTPPPTYQPPLYETEAEMGDSQNIAPFANMVEVEEALQVKREITVKAEPWEEE